MRRVMVMTIAMTLGAARAEPEKRVADSPDAAFAAIEGNDKLQRGVLSSLVCAADLLKAASKTVVERERRLARETDYVRPEVLRESRRLLERSEAWRDAAKKQLRDRRVTAMRCTAPGIGEIAGCIAATEMDGLSTPACSQADSRGAVNWALADEQ